MINTVAYYGTKIFMAVFLEYMGLYHNTYYGRNLLIFVKRVFVDGKPFQPSIMFTGKSGASLSEAPFRCSTLG
jgi:hypothetical protein